MRGFSWASRLNNWLDLIGQAVTRAVAEIHFIVRNATSATWGLCPVLPGTGRGAGWGKCRKKRHPEKTQRENPGIMITRHPARTSWSRRDMLRGSAAALMGA